MRPPIIAANEPPYIGHAQGRPQLYVGAGNARRRWAKTVYANPYRVPTFRPRVAAELYVALWRARLAGRRRRHWFAKLRALDGAALICDCKSDPCHARILAELFAEYFNTKERTT